MDSFERDKLENMRAFIFSETVDGRISEQTSTELVRIIDEMLSNGMLIPNV